MRAHNRLRMWVADGTWAKVFTALLAGVLPCGVDVPQDLGPAVCVLDAVPDVGLADHPVTPGQVWGW